MPFLTICFWHFSDMFHVFQPPLWELFQWSTVSDKTNHDKGRLESFLVSRPFSMLAQACEAVFVQNLPTCFSLLRVRCFIGLRSVPPIRQKTKHMSKRCQKSYLCPFPSSWPTSCNSSCITLSSIAPTGRCSTSHFHPLSNVILFNRLFQFVCWWIFIALSNVISALRRAL